MTEEKKTFENVYEVLSFVQKNIVAPKTQYNKFGEYYYRDAEDILEAAKKVMPDGATITVTDNVVFVGCDTELSTIDEGEKTKKSTVQKSAGRVYIQSTAKLVFKGMAYETSGLAREELSKKGMDASQVTTATSSYARKIALNGLLMIDDSKDADKTDKTTKKEKEDQALMEKTGTDNLPDAKAADALGGSVRKQVDTDTVIQMYEQALEEIRNCDTLEKLKAAYAKQYKARMTYSEAQFADIELAKETRKEEIEVGK